MMHITSTSSIAIVLICALPGHRTVFYTSYSTLRRSLAVRSFILCHRTQFWLIWGKLQHPGNALRVRAVGRPLAKWKTADEVLSMLCYVLQFMKNHAVTANSRFLRLHANNCGGQSKKSFILFYLLFATICGHYYKKDLCFIFTVHKTFLVMDHLVTSRNVSEVETCSAWKIWCKPYRTVSIQQIVYQVPCKVFKKEPNFEWFFQDTIVIKNY